MIELRTAATVAIEQGYLAPLVNLGRSALRWLAGRSEDTRARDNAALRLVCENAHTRGDNDNAALRLACENGNQALANWFIASHGRATADNRMPTP